jgi:hypothetical protein
MEHRELSEKERAEFRAWARTNYKPGTPINETWHPITREECALINNEVERHVDTFIDTPGGNRYARWVLFHFRLPAYLKAEFWEFMQEHKLFCTYEGERYRCTGASRMGDVFLAKDFDRDAGYDKRVMADECSEWDRLPHGTCKWKLDGQGYTTACGEKDMAYDEDGGECCCGKPIEYVET